MKNKIVPIVVCMVCASLLLGCAELKDTGKTIGHAAKDVTKTIGHASRDAAKSISKKTKEIVSENNK